MTTPVKMRYEDKVANVNEVVLVYDWIHSEYDLMSYGFCWSPDTKSWRTVPAYMLTPITRV